MPEPKPKEREAEQPESDEEIARRRDDALRRALNTPPTPHTVRTRKPKRTAQDKREPTEFPGADRADAGVGKRRKADG